jgi:hypothetical protein
VFVLVLVLCSGSGVQWSVVYCGGVGAVVVAVVWCSCRGTCTCSCKVLVLE